MDGCNNFVQYCNLCLCLSGVCLWSMTRASWGRSPSMTCPWVALWMKLCAWSRPSSTLTNMEKVSKRRNAFCLFLLPRAFSGINTHCWIYGPHGDHRTALIQQNMISAVLGKVRVWFRLSTMRRSQYRNIPAAPTFFFFFFLKASDVIYFICITTFHIYSMYIFWGRSYFKWVCL